jgi:hypothetical protein
MRFSQKYRNARKDLTMIAYKLVRKRKDGSIGSLFINRAEKLPFRKWLEAEDHPTKGFKDRQGWHCVAIPHAPHLSLKDRVWVKVRIRNYQIHERSEHQGHLWYVAQKIKILKEL